MEFHAAAAKVMERCDLLSRYSEEEGRITRRFATPPMRQANELVMSWMRDAGMDAHVDAIGNVIGRYEADVPYAQTLLFGSHLDTVPNAGKYDGTLGILIALTFVEHLHSRGVHLPFALEILGFSDEEGVRYHTTYLGSKAVAGTFALDTLDFLDADGISMADAIRSSGGNPDPDVLRTPRWRSSDLLGYCEIHIEQGPVLESEDLPVGIVSAIAGQRRFSVRFLGLAGHAGTVPMPLRRDALCAASEFVLAVESFTQTIPGLVATVGQLVPAPGASNVIPGLVSLTLDIRHQDDEQLSFACERLFEQGRTLSLARHVEFMWDAIQEHPTVVCSPYLLEFLIRAVERTGYPARLLPSGAGHDGVALSSLTDIAMLFVRCQGGISHHPLEAVCVDDVAVALHILAEFVTLLS